MIKSTKKLYMASPWSVAGLLLATIALRAAADKSIVAVNSDGTQEVTAAQRSQQLMRNEQRYAREVRLHEDLESSLAQDVDLAFSKAQQVVDEALNKAREAAHGAVDNYKGHASEAKEHAALAGKASLWGRRRRRRRRKTTSDSISDEESSDTISDGESSNTISDGESSNTISDGESSNTMFPWVVKWYTDASCSNPEPTPSVANVTQDSAQVDKNCFQVAVGEITTSVQLKCRGSNYMSAVSYSSDDCSGSGRVTVPLIEVSEAKAFFGEECITVPRAHPDATAVYARLRLDGGAMPAESYPDCSGEEDIEEFWTLERYKDDGCSELIASPSMFFSQSIAVAETTHCFNVHGSSGMPFNHGSLKPFCDGTNMSIEWYREDVSCDGENNTILSMGIEEAKKFFAGECISSGHHEAGYVKLDKAVPTGAYPVCAEAEAGPGLGGVGRLRPGLSIFIALASCVLVLGLGMV